MGLDQIQEEVTKVFRDSKGRVHTTYEDAFLAEQHMAVNRWVDLHEGGRLSTGRWGALPTREKGSLIFDLVSDGGASLQALLAECGYGLSADEMGVMVKQMEQEQLDTQDLGVVKRLDGWLLLLKKRLP